MKSVKAATEKLRELVNRVRSSGRLTEELSVACAADNKEKRRLQLDVRTRWSSLFYMMETAVELRPALVHLRQKYQDLEHRDTTQQSLIDAFPSDSAWDLLKDLANMLRLLAVLTTFSEGEVRRMLMSHMDTPLLICSLSIQSCFCSITRL